jgi:hypothetical protein
MDATTIRQRLHTYLEAADDKKVKAIYSILEQDVEATGVIYTEELKAELDKRHNNWQENPSTGIDEQQSNERIQNMLNIARKK